MKFFLLVVLSLFVCGDLLATETFGRLFPLYANEKKQIVIPGDILDLKLEISAGNLDALKLKEEIIKLEGKIIGGIFYVAKISKIEILSTNQSVLEAWLVAVNSQGLDEGMIYEIEMPSMKIPFRVEQMVAGNSFIDIKKLEEDFIILKQDESLTLKQRAWSIVVVILFLLLILFFIQKIYKNILAKKQEKMAGLKKKKELLDLLSQESSREGLEKIGKKKEAFLHSFYNISSEFREYYDVLMLYQYKIEWSNEELKIVRDACKKFKEAIEKNESNRI